MYSTVNVLIVDDHPLFRQGVRWALSNERDIKIAGETSTAEEALAMIADHEPDVVLTDFNLPGMNGVEFTRTVRRQYPSLGVVMLSIYESDEHAFNALSAGAAAYYSKEISPKSLANALRRVARGEYVINEVMFEDPRIADRILLQFRGLHSGIIAEPDLDISVFSPLSDREIEVLEHIAGGSANKDIADSLGISTQTVKNHISSILRKLSLNDRTQAVLYALRRGWIDTPIAPETLSNLLSAGDDDVE
ncbi:MAG: response regulator transcription factor [Herpetosiphonaceae bacterium]|nr:response regulator transcription factor [Herpetosiphonaceae bacterium]